MVSAIDLIEYLNEPPDSNAWRFQHWLDAAREEARSAGVPELKNNALYDQFILELAAWHYDNRGLQVSGTYQATALATKKQMVDSYVLQLRYTTEDDADGRDEQGEEGAT